MSRLTEAQAALEMLVAEAGGQPPTAAELNACPDAPGVLEAALARMAQLEKVAAVAREIVRETATGLPHLDAELENALTELDAP